MLAALIAHAILTPPPPGFPYLKAAYPDHICSFDENAVVWCDGTRMAWDDGRKKTHAERLKTPDF